MLINCFHFITYLTFFYYEIRANFWIVWINIVILIMHPLTECRHWSTALFYRTLVYSYLFGRDVASALNPFICEISLEESYKIVQDERDFSE